MISKHTVTSSVSELFGPSLKAKRDSVYIYTDQPISVGFRDLDLERRVGPDSDTLSSVGGIAIEAGKSIVVTGGIAALGADVIAHGSTATVTVTTLDSDSADRAVSLASPAARLGSPTAGASTDVSDVQGYMGLLTPFYFAGSATETEIDDTNVDTWVDAQFTVDAAGTFDNRPTSMKLADATGVSGSGAAGDPIVLNLEGLDTHSAVNFRASMSYEPDVDESQLQTRLLFNRHSGTTPSADFDALPPHFPD